jgi:hypothetical protein
MTTAEKPRTQPPPPRKRHRAATIFAIIAVVIVGIIIVAVASCGGGAATTYRARMVSHWIINPASVGFQAEVTNTGSSAGKPDCTVQASDPSSAYTGIDIFTAKQDVQPHQTVRFTGSLIITGQGARYVTSYSIKCK